MAYYEKDLPVTTNYQVHVGCGRKPDSPNDWLWLDYPPADSYPSVPNIPAAYDCRPGTDPTSIQFHHGGCALRMVALALPG